MNPDPTQNTNPVGSIASIPMQGDKKALYLLLFVSTFAVMSGAAIAPAQPEIAEAFNESGGSEFLVKLVLTIPALFIAIGSPFVGAVSDRWGRRRLLFISLSLYGLSGGICFISSSLWEIIALRAVMGISVAGVMVSATTLLGDIYGNTALRRVMGLQAAFMASGAIVHSLAGGLLADIGWQFPFLLYLVSFLTIPVALGSIREPAKAESNLNDKNGNRTKKPVYSLLTTVVILALGLTGNIVFYLAIVQTPFLLRQSFGLDGTMIGLALACLNVFSAITAVLYGRLKRKWRFATVAIIQILSVAAGYYLISIAGDYKTILIAMAFSGVGQGLLPSNLYSWLIAISPETSRGRLIGGLTSCMFFGQFVSPIVFAPVGGTVGIAAGFAWFAAFQVLLVLIFGVGLFIKRSMARGTIAGGSA